MDEGHAWALSTFGPDGGEIRQRVADLTRDQHSAMVDAQEASGQRNRGVYGQIWRGLLEQFESLAAMPGGELHRPGHANYRIPVINGVAIYPWRYSGTREVEFAETAFVTSDARAALFTSTVESSQALFDIDLGGRTRTEEEEEILQAREALIEQYGLTSKLVVVAIASSPLGLYEVRWGEAVVGEDGCLIWEFSEDLGGLAPVGPVPVADGSKTFVDGEPPTKGLSLQADANEGDAEGSTDDE